MKIEDGHLPFAARIMQRGAAMAVGMAGEVRNRHASCFRFAFTRRC